MLLWLAFSVLPHTLDKVHEAIATETGTDHVDEDLRLTSL